MRSSFFPPTTTTSAIGEPDETGDNIYNGALDNGVAMAQVLSVAEAISALSEPPRRSVMVFFPAAEEQGLLGSKYYTEHPTIPPGKIAADINFELGNVWGRTADVTIFGKGKSTLEDLLADLVAEQGRYVTEESTPRSGWYYRSDQFSFAQHRRAGDLVQVGHRLHRPAGRLGRAAIRRVDRAQLSPAVRRGRGLLEPRRSGRGRSSRVPPRPDGGERRRDADLVPGRRVRGRAPGSAGGIGTVDLPASAEEALALDACRSDRERARSVRPAGGRRLSRRQLPRASAATRVRTDRRGAPGGVGFGSRSELDEARMDRSSGEGGRGDRGIDRRGSRPRSRSRTRPR